MSASAVRWGILGTGKIVHDFLQSLNTLPSGEHEALAVASKSLERCNDFCRERGIPRSYGSYEELCKDKDIDVVYVGTLTSEHIEHVELALRHGKHILCEKPLSTNLPDMQRVFKLAKEKNLLLMEALWTRFFPLWKDVQKMILDGKIGEVTVVMATFGFKFLETMERLKDPKLGGGALLDIGIYVLNVADMMFGGEEPLSITATGHNFDTGVDHTVAISILYSRNRVAHLLISAGADLPCDAKVIGTEGSLTIERPMWCPVKLITPDGPKEYPLPSTEKPTNFVNSVGLRYEIEAFGEYFKSKTFESDLMPHETSQRIMGWIDEIRQQIGVPIL